MGQLKDRLSLRSAGTSRHATDATGWPGLSRRQWLAASAVAALAPTAFAATSAGTNPAVLPLGPGFAPPDCAMVAAWQADETYQVGVLRQAQGRFAVQAALDVPTRAHGVWVERGGTLLAAARRPGDWLLRWRRDGTEVAWAWIEPDRSFNGHVIASADGSRLYTTESDLETGQGVIGVRDAASLQKIAEWRTHGMDPHELLLDAVGSLLVANGGVPTLPETGRVKIHLEQMDASLVRLDTRSGALLGQWRLPDQRLSLRHIAWGQAATDKGMAQVLGIALQGEHADPQARAAAPVLAMFDGQKLRTVEAPQQMQGYGGDIAFASGRFAVSCPRAQGVALWNAVGQWAGFVPLEEACPLTVAAAAGSTSGSSLLWAGGREQALAVGLTQAPSKAPLDRVRLDNHWVVLPG